METSKKTCFKCGAIKSLSDFYRHSQMGDEHLNKCKECTKLDMRLHLAKSDVRERCAAYDKARQQTPERRAQKRRYEKRRKERFPEKEKARYSVTNAVRDGRLVRKPCEVCHDPKSQAHHLDYNQPLAVRWLCFRHHRAIHGQRMREAA